ncbi:MAG TPA: carbohydrate kinase [Streptosporangiaceae bacterium]|nr:carbohydrate kinase [Streptosporangiaceae bacterium]
MSVVVVGEALVDLTADEGDPTRFTAHPGGSPANVAVTLARLGTPVRFAGRLARDGFGRLLRAHLTGNGVDLSLCVDAAEPAGLAVVTRAADGHAEYAFHVTGTADWQWKTAELPHDLDADTLAIHTGSLALALAPGGPAIAVWLAEQRRAGRVISLDPNVRPAVLHDPRWYRPRLESWAGRSDIVKASVEDLAWVYPGEDPDGVALRWSVRGSALVVITHGAAGVDAVVDGQIVRRPARPATVADTVGAGDAVSGALLDWLARHDRLSRAALAAITPSEMATALDFAAEVAAVTVSRPGADPPHRDELGVAVTGSAESAGLA